MSRISQHTATTMKVYLIASESMCTGAILSSRNFTISRKGFVGCLGYVNLRVISLCNGGVGGGYLTTKHDLIFTCGQAHTDFLKMTYYSSLEV